MSRLSCAIITRNEERHLPLCLQSVSFADEIVVVDSQSTDGTVEIARRFGCRVFVKEFEGFGPQKQFAIDRCKGDWIFLIDADERVPEETKDKIMEVLRDHKGFNAFGFRRKNLFHGRWMKHGGLWPDRVVRLFRRGKGHMVTSLVHERLVVEGKVLLLDAPLLHLLESSLHSILKKIDLYGDLYAQEAFRKGERSSIPMATLHAGFAFIYKYFVRLGLLDGREGLLFAGLDAFARFVKYAKLWELGIGEGSAPSK